MLKNPNWFCQTDLITLVLLMWKWVGVLFRKNYLLRCCGWFPLLNWIGALILFLLLKLPRRKMEPSFVLWSFFLLKLLRFMRTFMFHIKMLKQIHVLTLFIWIFFDGDDITDFHINYEKIPTKDAKSKDQVSPLKRDEQSKTNASKVCQSQSLKHWRNVSVKFIKIYLLFLRMSYSSSSFVVIWILF